MFEPQRSQRLASSPCQRRAWGTGPATGYPHLEVLTRRAGAVVPHNVLLQEVWEPDYLVDPQYLKVFVRRLRNKLGDDPEHSRYIQSIRDTGYRFAPLG